MNRLEVRCITHTDYALTRAELLLAFCDSLVEGCLVGVVRHKTIYINKEAARSALHQHFKCIRRPS